MHSITSVIVIDFIRGYFPVFPPIGASNDAHFEIYFYILPDQTPLNKWRVVSVKTIGSKIICWELYSTVYFFIVSLNFIFTHFHWNHNFWEKILCFEKEFGLNFFSWIPIFNFYTEKFIIKLIEHYARSKIPKLWQIETKWCSHRPPASVSDI